MTVALVTGANKGIGFAVVRTLGQRGFKVWLGARSDEFGRAAEARLRAEKIDVTFIQLDVTAMTSISSAAERVAASDGVLDDLTGFFCARGFERVTLDRRSWSCRDAHTHPSRSLQS